MSDHIEISITQDEALVAFEWLCEARPEGLGDAERVALDAIVAALEERLATPFETNYTALLEAARIRLAERG